MTTGKNPKYGLQGEGFRVREDGRVEPFEDVQLFFYDDGRVSGSFVCEVAGICGIGDSAGVLWVLDNGKLSEGKLQFGMVHMELRYPRDPIAIFVGDYNGEGTYSGRWESSSESGAWQLHLRKTVYKSEEITSL